MNKWLFLSIGFVCVELSTPAFSEPTIVEQGGVGSCGTGCSWVFYDDGKLEVIGSEKMQRLKMLEMDIL